ncbi:MAG: phosphoglycerate kinase, partial [Candidatus Omnitrophota bacterium]
IKSLKAEEASESTRQLLNYFLVGLSLPDDSFWVNLRPDSENEIIDNFLAKTDVGKIMLEADLQLKKDAARFTSPEASEGRAYWNKLYKKAKELYGYEQATIPAITRPWIVPNEIIVRETKDSAYIYKATLKVMLEEDYLKGQGSKVNGQGGDYNFNDVRAKELNEYSAQLVRELIIPKLAKEVNVSKRYAALRQVYYSLIFSRWFKSKFANQSGKYSSLIDSKNLSGLSSAAAWSKSTYFNAYKNSFAQGEYNVKETVPTPTGQAIRSYFSGGVFFPEMPISGITTSSALMAGTLGQVGLVMPEGMSLADITTASSAVSMGVRGLDDLTPVIKAKGIKAAMGAFDWNVPIKDGKISDPQKIELSADTVINLLQNGIDELFAITHIGRPKGNGFEEEYSLKPAAEALQGILADRGLTDVEVVLLPYDLDDAKREIERKRITKSGKKIIFVAENIRFYKEEQLKADKKDSDRRKADIMAEKLVFMNRLIALTGTTSDKLVYINEGFDKAHRGDESSIQMIWLFPEENRAAGYKFAGDTQAVLDFQSRVTGTENAMIGGAKDDKLKTFVKLARRIAGTKGKLMIAGALVNPYFASEGYEMGQSLMPKAEALDKAYEAIAQIKASGVEVIVPEDFLVREGRRIVKLGEFSPGDYQIDTGTKSTKKIVDNIDSLEEGDGLILNGGPGLFDLEDAEGGSKEGTIQIIMAANRAAERGVAVIFAGGDMNNAVKIAQAAKPDLQLDPRIRMSTSGGALLTALAEGVANLSPVRALLKMDPTEALSWAHYRVTTALRGTALLTLGTVYKDTSIDGSDANRSPALDLFRKNGINVAVPGGPLAYQADLLYEYLVMPVLVLSENIPQELREKLSAAKDENSVTVAVQEQLKGFLEGSVNMTEKQQRSSKLDVAKLGPAAVDFPSIIAVQTPDGDLLVQVPMWVKRNSDQAMEALNNEIKKDLKDKSPVLARMIKEPLAWPKQDPDVSTHPAAIEALAKYAPLFFDELSKGDLTHVGLLSNIVKNIQPESMINPEGIKYDPVLNAFISDKDKGSKTPGFGKHLESFLGSINTVQQLSWLLYLLTAPTVDDATGAGVALKDRELQDAVARFYARTYRNLLKLAQEHFKDARVFEPLRAQIGENAQRFNKAVRAADALELNRSEANKILARDVMDHLNKNGIRLSNEEEQNIARVYTQTNGVFAWDILQLASMLSVDNFVKAFRHLKVDDPKKVLPSEKLNEGIDGTGRVARIALVYRLASDLAAGETGYISKFMLRTRAIKGDTDREKFESALKTAIEMFNDLVIKQSGLLKGKNITFEAGTEVLPAQLDFQTTHKVPGVYPVNILVDGKKAGVIYFTDISMFNEGLKDSLSEEGVSLDNIPRPFIIYEGGVQYYFGLVIDGTPGGVEIGDQELVAASKDGKAKLSGPTVWESAAKHNLDDSSEALAAPEELQRLQAILKQVEDSRLSKTGEKQSLIYITGQILKKLLLPLGGIDVSGAFLHKLPLVKAVGAMLFTPTSCSTTGATSTALPLSVLFGGSGTRLLTVMGMTLHEYTTGDKKGLYGDFNPKSTGAAKGVKQHLLITALFTALRTPTGLKDGSTDIIGGSIFDWLIQLPENVSVELVRKYLLRIGAEYPEILRVFNEADKVDGRYRWQDTITGQRTGSILYEDFIEQVLGSIYRLFVGYDNEIGFSERQNEAKESVFYLMKRQADIAALLETAPLANTEAMASSSLATDASFMAEPSQASSSLGGIDFRSNAMMLNYQPMGNFSGLNPKLPSLSWRELVRFDVGNELMQIEAMLDGGILPSGARIKEVLAACSQKGTMDANRQQLMALLMKMGMLEERDCCLTEASREYKEALMLAEAL